MSIRLGKKAVHLANLPIKLLMPSSFTNITEFAIKTIPSANKIEIKRVMETLYGFEVDEVRTLNMDGKKKKFGGILLAKPQYKKAYIMLKHPLSISPDLFPIPAIEQDKKAQAKQAKSRTGTVEDEQSGGWKKSHWLDEKKVVEKVDKRGKGSRGNRRGGLDRIPPKGVEAKFPFSYLADVGMPTRDGRGRTPTPGRGRSPAPNVVEAKFPWSNLKTLYSR